ncbi:hypothetical protein WG929_21110, partial [Oceanobacter sp. wDCs-4]
PETATLQERYHSILQNCRRLNGINVLLKRSILDNWVENYRKSPFANNTTLLCITFNIGVNVYRPVLSRWWTSQRL